jgi:23S rRNA pseudouridine2605 synthase
MSQSTERLQKYLARAGIGSRRKCEDLIRSGRVTVNGKIAIIGQSVNELEDRVHLDGELVTGPERLVYVVMNKPPKVLCSLTSQGGHSTVIDLIDVRERVYPVGRLDLESQGLILLTNDGDLANQLSHPRYGHEKEYRVLLNRLPDPPQLKAWRSGVLLATGEKTLPAQVFTERNSGNQAWVRVTMRQGLKRQIRKTAQVLGLFVIKLIRVRIGPLKLAGLGLGEWRFLSRNEVNDLKKSVRV